MTTTFDIVTEEFLDDAQSIRNLILTFAEPTHPGNMRIAASNSATLLIAATFEEYIREMAREYARSVVTGASRFEDLPMSLISTAWKRTMESLVRINVVSENGSGGRVAPLNGAEVKFSSILKFCTGDLSQDVFGDLIHNENNMRPAQLNALFKVSGLNNLCERCSHGDSLLNFFGETDSGKAHGKLLTSLNSFFDRRNDIAHSLNPKSSSSVEQIITDIELLSSFSLALRNTLNALVYPPVHEHLHAEAGR
jgi:hypothetical protein